MPFDPEGVGGTPQSGGTGTGGADQGSGGTSSGGASSGLVDFPLINGVRWVDTDGETIEAHGGGILKVGAFYYLYGENRNPDNSFRAVSMYRSTDLRTWDHVNDVLTSASDPELDGTNIERPKIVYNESTDQYVMWMHWEDGVNYAQARAAVASSPTIDGDYSYHGSLRPLAGTGVVDHGIEGYMSRDCTLFVDDDKTGYFLSTANENYDLHLYRLSDDYLSIVERSALLFEGEHREAPALFKREGRYFLVSSGSTGWQPNQGKYATSLSLSSGWSALSNLGNSTTYYSQSAFVLAVEGATTEYLYMGDRWAGAWGGRVNESSYLWQEIQFPTDSTLEMRWDNVLSFDTAAGTIDGVIADFKLVSEASGLVLAIDGDDTAPSGDAIQAADADSSSQIWKFDYDGAGHFELLNRNSGLVLDIPDESTAAGTALHQWEDVDADHQKWMIVDRGDGLFEVQSKKSGLVISVVDASLEAGARIEQASRTGGGEQLWRLQTVE